MKKSVGIITILVLLCVLFSVSVMATAKISVETINDKITDFEKGYAEFNIHVENTGLVQETYTLWNLDPPSWFAQVLPSTAYKEMMIGPGDTGTFHVLIKSSDIEKDRGKAIVVTAFIREASRPSTPYKAPMRVVVGETPSGLPPPADFDVSVNIPAQMDPRSTYNILVDIVNKNERPLEDVKVTLSSNLINEESMIEVAPEESKSATFAVVLFDDIKPQADSVRVLVEYEDEVFYDKTHDFEVVEYVPPFTKDIQVEKKFLRQDRTLTITNEGNGVKSDVVKLQASMKDKMFSSSMPEFTFVQEGDAYYMTWQVSLEAGDTLEINLVTSYRWLLLLVVVLILVLVYRATRGSQLVVKKKFQEVHKEHKGAVSDMSVVIYLKNKGNTSVSGIRVIEKVSKMVKLKHDSFKGSMHPSKMHAHGKGGTLLEYRFAELGPGDERIIKYKVYSRLHIFGTLVISPTVVEFKNTKGAKKKSKSREISLTAGSALPDKPVKHPKPVKKNIKHQGPPEGAEAADEDIELTAEDFQEVEDIEADEKD